MPDGMVGRAECPTPRLSRFKCLLGIIHQCEIWGLLATNPFSPSTDIGGPEALGPDMHAIECIMRRPPPITNLIREYLR